MIQLLGLNPSLPALLCYTFDIDFMEVDGGQLLQNTDPKE